MVDPLEADDPILARFRAIVQSISFPGWAIAVNRPPGDRYVLQVGDPNGTCNVTGGPLPWWGRKWRLSPHMTDGEVVQTAFLAVMTALEHEAREKFTYKGVTVFDPHLDIDKMVELRVSGVLGIKERES